MKHKRHVHRFGFILGAICFIALTLTSRQTALNAAPMMQMTLQDLWSAPVNISNSTNRSQQPRLRIDAAGNLHANWTDITADEQRICYEARQEGETWQITEQSCPAESLVELTSVFDALNVEHAVWTTYPEASGTYDVFYANRVEGGNWTPALNISRNAGWSRAPQVAIDTSGALHLVWYDDTPGNDDIFYTVRSLDGSWLEPLNISHNEGQSRYPRLALAPNGEVHVTWQDDVRGVEDIMYTVRQANGVWTEPIVAWASAQGARAPRIAVGSDSIVHIVWQDAEQGAEEVFYIALVNGAWSQVVNVSRSAGRSVQPRLAVDTQRRVHVIWLDDTLGYRDLFYAYGSARLPTPTPTNTPIFSPTPTNTPTNTPVPTLTSTPTPTPGALTFPFHEPQPVSAYYDLQFDESDKLCVGLGAVSGYCSHSQNDTAGLVYDAAHRPGAVAQLYREVIPWYYDTTNARWGHAYNQHNGTDYEAPANTAVIAAANGTVVGIFDHYEFPPENAANEKVGAAEFHRTNWIVLYHPDYSLWTAYLHIAPYSAVHYNSNGEPSTHADGQPLPLKIGDRVWRGQIIAKTRGGEENSYLHFGVRIAETAKMISWDAEAAPWLDPYDAQLWRNHRYHGMQPELYTNIFPNPQFTMSSAFAWALTALTDSESALSGDLLEQNLAVEFDGSTSSDADGSVANYAWDFGDGQSNAEPIVFHGYNKPGTYYAALTVTDDSGAPASSAPRSVVVKDPNQPLNVELLDYVSLDEVPLELPFEHRVELSPTLRAAFHVEWQQPYTVNLSLTSPENRIITAAVPSPNISYIEMPGSAFYLLDNPQPGLYTMRVETVTQELTATAPITAMAEITTEATITATAEITPPRTPTATSSYPAPEAEKPPLALFITIADVRPPRGSIEIRSATGFTNTTNVLLRLSASDPGNTPGVQAMRFSDDGVNFGDWEMYIPQRQWELPPGDGFKYVYVQYRDAAGNESPIYFANIILDTAPPKLEFTRLLSDTAQTGAGEFRWEARDAGLSLASVQYAFYIEGYDADWSPLTTTTSLSFEDLPSGEYAFWLRAEDLTGNSSALKQSFVVQKEEASDTHFIISEPEKY